MMAKVQLPAQDGHTPIVPVLIPDLDDVRAFSDALHEAGIYWSGEAFG